MSTRLYGSESSCFTQALFATDGGLTPASPSISESVPAPAAPSQPWTGPSRLCSPFLEATLFRTVQTCATPEPLAWLLLQRSYKVTFRLWILVSGSRSVIRRLASLDSPASPHGQLRESRAAPRGPGHGSGLATRRRDAA